jgi:hypothetical protein
MMRQRSLHRCVIAVLAAACSAVGLSQTAPPVSLDPLSGANAFPFVMPWDAKPTGTAMDASFLNPLPAGANGRIIVRNGQFVESKTGKRVRFFGVNLGAAAAFPPLEDAEGIARRLRVLGVNLARFHHINNGWDLEGGTIWKPGRTFLEIDPRQLQKLDNFVAALKRNGIYTNINLQTAREYLPELGLPETSRTLPNFGKKADKFFPRMIEIQKEYAKELLDRVNPYTRLRYKDDPALLKIEINNENSIVGWPGDSPGAGLASLPSPFQETLVRMWNQWLIRKYGSDAGLRRAWPRKDARTGPSLVTKANVWTTENQGQGDVIFKAEEGSGSDSTAPTLVSTVNKNSGPAWHVQSHLGGLNLTNGKAYTVQFRAKADREVTVDVSSRLDKPDWGFLGLSSTIKVGKEWQEYRLTWNVSGTEPNHARVGFVLGGMVGTLTVADLSIREGLVSVGLPEGESAEAGTVTLPPSEVSPRSRDYLAFLAETETAYAEEMRSFLVKNLGFTQTHIIDTQTSWGGLTSFMRERGSSFRDDHYYWNHPTFLGADWDPKNYRVDRRALVDEIGRSNGTLGAAAVNRVLGKPHSISEYNHPAPNDYQVEMMPLYAAFAAHQDWDCIYVFAWDATGTGRNNSMYSNYFDAALNPAKYAFFPAAAMNFRLGLIPAAAQQRILTLPATPWQPHLAAGDAWKAFSPNPLTHRLAMRVGKGTSSSSEVRGTPSEPVFRSRPGKGGAIVTAHSPSSKNVIGFVGGAKVSVPGMEAVFGSFGAQFAALTVNSTDGASVETAKRSLLTLGARFENNGMGWNESRTSVSDVWGSGPTMAEVVPVTVTLRVDGPRRVFALKPDGTRGAAIPSMVRNGRLTFVLGNQSRAVWVEIVKG